MATTNFRRVDVDALDPDNAPSADLYPQFPVVTANDVAALSQEAKSALSKGDFAGSLAVVLSSPPYGGDEATKVCVGHRVDRALPGPVVPLRGGKSLTNELRSYI